MALGNRIHIIGIGGIGVSALARMLLHDGKTISGTEDNQSPETLDALRAQGVEISLDLDPAKLPQADCYIYSDAWDTRQPHFMAGARTKGVPMFSLYEALGMYANTSKCLIAVCGAHGKTSTTAMLIDVLEAADLNPTGFVGSLRAKTKSNFRAGGSEYFVAEADEWNRHFLQYQPKILVILNIDADHLDYYKDLADIQSAFRALAQKVPLDGFIVCDPNDANVRPALEGVSAKIVDYKKYFDPQLPLKVLPLHRMNAAAVLAVADLLHIDGGAARQALAEFSGTWRRFEFKGKTAQGADVYDDYAHHPAEIRATLCAAREQFPNRKFFVAFHPHLYSRTKLLFDEFAAAFADADEVLIAPIFAAREEPDPSISSEKLAEKIAANGKPAKALDFDAIADYLRTVPVSGDIVITMGAGDIYKVAEAICKI